VPTAGGDELLTQLEGVPSLIVPVQQLSTLGVDHRAGFIATFIDGVSTLEMVLDACGLPRALALGLIADLVRRGAIAIRN
jgi:hypothetical protein